MSSPLDSPEHPIVEPTVAQFILGVRDGLISAESPTEISFLRALDWHSVDLELVADSVNDTGAETAVELQAALLDDFRIHLHWLRKVVLASGLACGAAALTAWFAAATWLSFWLISTIGFLVAVAIGRRVSL